MIYISEKHFFHLKLNNVLLIEDEINHELWFIYLILILLYTWYNHQEESMPDTKQKQKETYDKSI